MIEALEPYLDRKYQELQLLNESLAKPVQLARPASVVDVIKSKFQMAAALKADHALHDWALTETDWTESNARRSGPFTFSYDYQRADLDVRGPSFYRFEGADRCETIYTSSGMAAIAALLLASVRVIGEAEILLLPGSYGETIELLDGYARDLHRVVLTGSLGEARPRTGRRRLLLLDSCTTSSAFEATLRSAPELDLIIFDTTCFASGSGRIQRAVNWARGCGASMVLVRSHTKLDSLGVEYGRLGSAVFLETAAGKDRVQLDLRALVQEMRNAVRLFGGAALPAHFPPYAGSEAYRTLTSQRVAAMLRNSRRTVQYFASALAESSAELHFAHGLYVTLASAHTLDEQQAKRVAAELAEDLSRAGLPLRHAGSFGFDFGATEWFHDVMRDRHLVRVAVPDLPTLLWDDVSRAIAKWWSARHTSKAARQREHRHEAAL